MKTNRRSFLKTASSSRSLTTVKICAPALANASMQPIKRILAEHSRLTTQE